MRNLMLVLALCVSCGAPEPIRRNAVLSMSGFEQYIESFENDAQSYNQMIEIKDLVIRFKDTSSHNVDGDKKVTMGVCWYDYSFFAPTIDIDPEGWKTLSELRRKMLVYHELGHCILRRDHIEDKLSVMNPGLMSENIAGLHYEYLLEELFDSSTYSSLGLIEVADDSSSDSDSDDVGSGIPIIMGYYP